MRAEPRPSSMPNAEHWQTDPVPSRVHYLNPGSPPYSPTLHWLNPDPSAAVVDKAQQTKARLADIRAAAILTVALLAVGAGLGLLWSALAPPGPLAVVWNSKHQLVIDETEAWIDGDAKFAIIMLCAGLVAGLATWFVKPLRSMYSAAALAVGGVGGAYLTSVVGYYARGTVDVNKPVGTLIKHAPLGVHIRGFFLLEAVVALLVFLLFVAFTERDDLGRGN